MQPFNPPGICNSAQLIIARSLPILKATDDLSNIILVVVNLDPNNTQHGYVQLPKAKLNLTDKINVKLHDLITDEHFTWTQEWNYVHLNPNISAVSFIQNRNPRVKHVVWQAKLPMHYGLKMQLSMN
jgi:hypothetical protein